MKKIIKRRGEQEEGGLESDNVSLSLVEKIFRHRQVFNKENRDYSLKKVLHPSTLKGLDRALSLLIDCLHNQKTILILGDFDADGATSTALAVRCLKAFGYQHVEYLVPNRFEYGYGLTPEIVEVASHCRPDMIITVDNGISSIDGVEYAHEKGIKVLVTDHHLPGKKIPEADAIVNPNQHGCEFLSKNLAGVGVIFYLMSALRTELRNEGWFEAEKLPIPNMATFLDLVALGTIADVVPLDYNNRILVAQGLARMRAGHCVEGIQAILHTANRSLESVVSSDLGFAVGPRLNAAGRLDDMSLGIRCLLSDSAAEARQIAEELNELNQDRKSIEASMQKEALALLDALSIAQGEQVPAGLCLYENSWHVGVIGILASRIKERIHRPTIVFAKSDDDELKGSGRSIEGIHLRDVLDEVASQNPGLLEKFGGHAMAAGLSLKTEDYDRFKLAFDDVVSKYLNEENSSPVIFSDGEVGADEFVLDTAKILRDLGPWGQGFPEPQFDGEFVLVEQRIVAHKHLKMRVSPRGSEGLLLDAIAFNVDTQVWPDASITKVQLVFKLDVNEYRGKESLQLLVDHLCCMT